MKKTLTYLFLALSMVLGKGAGAASSSGIVEKLFVQKGTGAVPRTFADKATESVSVSDFGAIPNDGNDDSAAFNKAITYVKASKQALRIPGGTWTLASGAVNFGATGLHIVGEGKPILQFTGTGNGFVMDSGANGAWLQGMTVENITIIGSPTISDGFYSRGIVRSVFRNIEVREVSGKAFHILHGVSNHYDSIKYSAQGQTTKALTGLYVTNNGTGYYTADCTFTNTIMEDFPGNGAVLNDASGNNFQGGTFEGNAVGMVVKTGSRRNQFSSLWFEANTTRDVEVNSTANSFVDSYFGSASSGPNIEVATGKGTTFRGGYLRTANLQSTSRDTVFSAVGFDQNTGGTLGITGTGTYKIIASTKIDNTGEVIGQINDKMGPISGIKFANPREPSRDPKTLDDYEEGSWAGTLVAGGGSITMNSALSTGSYTKVGRLVTVTGIFDVSTVSAPTGALSLSGLPFPASTAALGRAAATVNGDGLQTTATGSIIGRILPGQSSIYIKKFASGAASEMASDVKAGTQFYISASYVTD